jgi:hypothetical protein
MSPRIRLVLLALGILLVIATNFSEKLVDVDLRTYSRLGWRRTAGFITRHRAVWLWATRILLSIGITGVLLELYFFR